MSRNRYPWVDHLKALGIFLVVAGHCTLPPAQHRWIYAFHMPLFFLISGFLLTPGAFGVPLRAFFQRRIWKLVKFYGWYGLLGTAVYCYVFKQEQSLAMALGGRLHSLLYASASRDTPADLYPMALWFFPGLISGLLIIFSVWKIPWLWARALTMAAVVTGGFLMVGWALPWEVESGCLAAGLLATGHWARLAAWDERLRQAGRRAWPVAAVALLIGSWLALLNTDCLDLRVGNIGNPLLALPACGLLIVALTVGAMRLSAWRISEAVAAATIVIFPTHMLFLPYLDRLVLKLGAPVSVLAANPAWYGWSKAAAIVAATTLVHACYRFAYNGVSPAFRALGHRFHNIMLEKRD